MQIVLTESTRALPDEEFHAGALGEAEIRGFWRREIDAIVGERRR